MTSRAPHRSLRSFLRSFDFVDDLYGLDGNFDEGVHKIVGNLTAVAFAFPMQIRKQSIPIPLLLIRVFVPRPNIGTGFP